MEKSWNEMSYEEWVDTYKKMVGEDLCWFCNRPLKEGTPTRFKTLFCCDSCERNYYEGPNGEITELNEQFEQESQNNTFKGILKDWPPS